MGDSKVEAALCPRCGEAAADGHTCGGTVARGKNKAALATSETLPFQSGSPSVQIDPSIDPMIGRLLGKSYRVLERIGAGGMGVVYVVEHDRLKKRFAAKVLTRELAGHPEAVARFEVEAHSASKLDHDNIVSVIDYGKTDDGTVFLVMELLRGESLEALVQRGPLGFEDALAIVVPVCHALAAAHAAGIVHRDMKPGNIFLTQRGLARPVVKVLDFGISKVRQDASDGRITKMGQVLGSPEYISPEAARGDEVDARADVYALGIILYELVSGQVPFRHENYLKVLQQHIGERPTPPSLLRPDLPLALERVILRALAKRPEDRHPSVEELEADLLAAVPEIAQRALFVPTHTPPAGVKIVSPSGTYRSASQVGARAVGSSSELARPGTPTPGSLTPAPVSLTPAPMAVATTPADRTLLDARPPTRGRGRWIALGAGVVALAVGLGWWKLHPAGGSSPAPRAAAAPVVHPTRAPVVAAAAPVAPTAAKIHLAITSTPPGAEVRLGPRSLGTTPLAVDLDRATASASLTLALDGYRELARDVVLDQDLALKLELHPIGHAGKKPKVAPTTSPNLDIRTGR